MNIALRYLAYPSLLKEKGFNTQEIYYVQIDAILDEFRIALICTVFKKYYVI